MSTGVLFGLLAAIEMAAPDFLGGYRALVFGRLRPSHFNTIIFGFLSMSLIGAGLHYVPHLCATRLYSDKLANAAMWLWNLVVLSGIVTFLLGYTSAHEYGEYIWPIDILAVITLLLLAYVVFRTIARREEPLIYVSIWYFGAALLWTAVTWAFMGGTGARYGLNDAVWTWFFGHNIFGLWVTPLALAVAYYVIPREARTPLYSHTLSLIAFWALITFYSHTGTHHLLQAPVPAWQKVIASIDSVMLLISVYAFCANVWLTLRGRLWRVEQSIALKFVFAGTIWFFIVSTQGSAQSLMGLQRLTHFTNWTVGHAHIGLLGFAGFIASGAIYGILPQVTGKPIYSAALANFQYWLMLLGTGGFAIVLTIAGLVQGSAWLNGEALYRVLPELGVYMVARAVLGTFVVVAAEIQLWNVTLTLLGRGPKREPLEPAISLFDQQLVEGQEPEGA
ncbi:MAG: cbb3-type cytochrome c oxidase subunit I [Armatimonadetes bacterium]|nr:cbb3-type cytochrome c oxidase subunit I [Armatimonadota bacterium]